MLREGRWTDIRVTVGLDQFVVSSYSRVAAPIWVLVSTFFICLLFLLAVMK